jgi:uncharacterized FlaG/YvyC family protein
MKVELTGQRPVENYKMNQSESVKLSKTPTPDSGRNDYNKQITEDVVAKKVARVNEELQQLNKNLEVSYQVHKDTKSFMVQVYDKAQSKVVFEFPSSKILDFAASREVSPVAVNEKV